MAAYFECSNCKAVTQILTSPPRCSKCGRGNGMIVSRNGHEEAPKEPAPAVKAIEQ
jgi:hypothetical protein